MRARCVAFFVGSDLGGDQLQPGLSHRFRSIAKTGRKRKIDLPENLLKWLAPYRNRSGAISDRDFGRPLARACEPARVKYKRNALRHSFGSYQMEMVKERRAGRPRNRQLCHDSDEALLRHRGARVAKDY